MSEQTESPQHQHSDVSEVLDRLVDEIAHAMQSGQSVDVDVLVREHPELAERLRRLIPSMQVLAHLGDSLAGSYGRAGHPTADAGTAPAALGDYRILGEIGRGGMGVVYEAEQLSMQRKVALKVLPFAAMLDRKALLRFQNEVRAAAMLEHPHIVPVYAVGEERGVHYFAMRLIHGRNLAALLEERRNPGGQTLSSVDELVPDEQRTTVAGPSLPAQPAANSAPEPVEAARESTAKNQAAWSTSHSQLGKDYYASVCASGDPGRRRTATCSRAGNRPPGYQAQQPTVGQRRPTVHHRLRFGPHHESSRHYHQR